MTFIRAHRRAAAFPAENFARDTPDLCYRLLENKDSGADEVAFVFKRPLRVSGLPLAARR